MNATAFASCDTFVALPPLTADGTVIFGKNSDRPRNEVQQLVHFPRQTHAGGSKLKVTYIEIDQAQETYAVLLSKPSWMWGAEMGSNEHCVAIGNEAIFTKETDRLGNEELLKPALLGMDLVRLGLERGKTAAEAKQVICKLLEQHGQGGSCVEKGVDSECANFSYHNSFLIADASEAWIVETIGREWAAKRVKNGFYSISNCLSIEADADELSAGLQTYAAQQGWLVEADGKLDFLQTFKCTDDGKDRERLHAGRKLLSAKTSKFHIEDMLSILRNQESGICRPTTAKFPTQGSQVSVLSKQFSSHWFTVTPNPALSIFKPVVFTPDLQLGKQATDALPDKGWKHQLYLKHEQFYANSDRTAPPEELLQLEKAALHEVSSIQAADPQMNSLFEDSVSVELRFYR